MPLTRKDKEFRLAKVSYLDFKQLEMDRVLTALFARLAHNGFPSRLRRKFEIDLDRFVEEFLEHPEWFEGFQAHPEILRRWVETHLLDLVNRGKANEAVAAPRPLHGYTYRFRNPKRSRDYGAAQQLYENLHHARNNAGQAALSHLYHFFFEGHDRTTGQADPSVTLDVETQALLRLSAQVKDSPDTTNGRESFPPLCIGSADLLADDIQRLLFYRAFIPRSVMVEYLKILLAFHLGLFHLRLFKLLPALVRRQAGEPACAPKACPMTPKTDGDPQGDCPFRIGILADLTGQPESDPARLAQRSADVHFRRIPGFVKAYFSVRKLDEFAHGLRSRGKLPKSAAGWFSVSELLQLLETPYKQERENFFSARNYGLMQDSAGAALADVDPEMRRIAELGLSEFDTYIETLVAVRGRFHRQYITECLDSLLLKNRPGALLAQSRAKRAPRRFVLDSRLLEVLLQLAVLRPGGRHGYHTGEMRIEELLGFLRQRYGIHIDRLPKGDGFDSTSMGDRKALSENLTAFKGRLREIGFYRDLSDAYVTQTITPRYRIAKEESGS